MSQGQRTSTGWKGEGYIEPIRGQQPTMFTASDQSIMVYHPRSVTLYSCGKCGIGLKEEEGGWPRTCAYGHVNKP